MGVTKMIATRESKQNLDSIRKIMKTSDEISYEIEQYILSEYW